MCERYYNEKGQLGVLISCNFGAGWSTTWNDKDIAFDKRIIEAFLAGIDRTGMAQLLDDCGYKDCYLGGFSDGLKVVWINKGTRFRINEYNGAESIEYLDENDWEIA